MPIRLVAIDLDGTLLNDAKQVTEPTARAIRQAVARGVKVILATARPPRSVRHIYQHLGLDGFQINYNGALIWDEPNNQPVYHRPMAGPLVQQIIDAARTLYADLLVSCEVMDRWYTDRHDPQYTTETGRLFTPDVICPTNEICRQAITKLMFLGHPELMTALEPVVSTRFGEQVTTVRADADLIQVMDNRVSKALAVVKIAEYHGIPMEQVMCLGDAPNDLGMLQVAGVAVAMANGHERVRQAAHWIAPSNNDDGVYAAMARYGLCE